MTGDDVAVNDTYWHVITVARAYAITVRHATTRCRYTDIPIGQMVPCDVFLDP
jgi:hypothetical protein